MVVWDPRGVLEITVVQVREEGPEARSSYERVDALEILAYIDRYGSYDFHNGNRQVTGRVLFLGNLDGFGPKKMIPFERYRELGFHRRIKLTELMEPEYEDGESEDYII